MVEEERDDRLLGGGLAKLGEGASDDNDGFCFGRAGKSDQGLRRYVECFDITLLLYRLCRRTFHSAYLLMTLVSIVVQLK